MKRCCGPTSRRTSIGGTSQCERSSSCGWGPLLKTGEHQTDLCLPSQHVKPTSIAGSRQVQTYGEAVDTTALIPNMFEAFITDDQRFERRAYASQAAPVRRPGHGRQVDSAIRPSTSTVPPSTPRPVPKAALTPIATSAALPI